MTAKQKSQLESKFRRMFKCDSARIISPNDTFFLIIGWRVSTRDATDGSQWYKNGRPIHFGYLQEKCIASGMTDGELVESAKHYKKITELPKAEAWIAHFKMLGVPITQKLKNEIHKICAA